MWLFNKIIKVINNIACMDGMGMQTKKKKKELESLIITS